MSQFIESVSIKDGLVENLDLHNLRCNKARLEVLMLTDTIDLSEVIKPPKCFLKGHIKCRVLFSDKVHEVSYEKYKLRRIAKIQVVENNTIEYAYKFLDRSSLNELYQQKRDADEILIVRNGLLTDAFYYNVALLKGDQWFTPKHPLLNGVQRSRLLKEELIKELDIKLKEINDFSFISLFNALTPLGAIQVPIENIDKLLRNF